MRAIASTRYELEAEAASAERLAEAALRRGFRYRSLGYDRLARVADERYVEEMTDARDLRATARDLV